MAYHPGNSPSRRRAKAGAAVAEVAPAALLAHFAARPGDAEGLGPWGALRVYLVADSHGTRKMWKKALRIRLFLRSEEHTSELQSLMRNSYAVFCLNKKKKT